MDKKTYYISVGNGEISQVKTADTYSFAIQATEEEIIELREYFDQAYREDLGSFVRSHVPYVEYHHDSNNDRYDEQLQKAYKLIYDLGDHETKELVAQMGIINGL
ncbi:hydrolase [Bacillus sp. DX1.1]|uniref:hydrolase n=1 Tax=unclassified Bacillus (in: firmicutes) TaxID=185979 RepID=UPI002570CAB9|nr:MULTISPECIES: hydrolase [unclassified Bacillus (in: firmicutes)]MDM5156949.1 hydrolase [Bacillus sp. DX1.1]WJE81190.1 hydrolase [Bacillus sp. DX3.1]